MPPKTKELAKKAHTHACDECLRRFVDDCAAPHEAKRCGHCIAGRVPDRAWTEGYEPRDCCRISARLADRDVMNQYSLSKAATWYFCPVCCRCFAFDPKDQPDTGMETG
jgi:hypothetical protein